MKRSPEKRKKPVKGKKNYPINIKIPGAICQMMSNTCTYFQKIPWTYFLELAWTNIMSTDGGQTDVPADRRTGRKKFIPQPLFAGVIKIGGIS